MIWCISGTFCPGIVECNSLYVSVVAPMHVRGRCMTERMESTAEEAKSVKEIK